MKKLFYLLFLILVASCSDDVIETSGLDIESDSYRGQPRSHKVSEQQAINTIMAHFAMLQNDALSRGESTSSPEVQDVRVLRSIDLGIDSIRCRDLYETVDTMYENFSDKDKVFLDTLFYIVNFEEKKGWAIIAADDRTDPIYAIIDEGNIKPNELFQDKNLGFLSVIDTSIGLLLHDVVSYEPSEKLDRIDIPPDPSFPQTELAVEKADPILKTKWGQFEPYNYRCPGPYTGCVITATAQIMSYYQTFDYFVHTQHGDLRHITLDWTQIMTDCSPDGRFKGSKPQNRSGENIAWFMAYLGHKMDAEYKTNETSAKSSKAIEWLNTYGNLNASTLKDYNFNNIKEALDNGNLAYANGYKKKNTFLGITTGYSGGHAWVYDGYLTMKMKYIGIEIDYSKYLHCNWGWNGSKNGYYLSKVFNTSNAYIEDEPDDYNEGRHYKYKLQYSIISNPNVSQ